MLFMVELEYSLEKREALTRYFESRGVTGHGDHLVVQGAWVSKTRRCFALVSAGNAESFRQMCDMWSEFGELTTTPVIDIQSIL